VILDVSPWGCSSGLFTWCTHAIQAGGILLYLAFTYTGQCVARSEIALVDSLVFVSVTAACDPYLKHVSYLIAS